ncbi:MAG: hypothetical protein SP4CHLAM5_08510 [Chlamydiia bacterium]|nr:hypothetical protein [Chlamydiia bacterium]MCH9618714.1 hypothetical protein [Chlamydiia bacterium]MCH9624394.1 hypothetical protein [Chlamydiia bacterium]
MTTNYLETIVNSPFLHHFGVVGGSIGMRITMDISEKSSIKNSPIVSVICLIANQLFFLSVINANNKDLMDKASLIPTTVNVIKGLYPIFIRKVVVERTGQRGAPPPILLVDVIQYIVINSPTLFFHIGVIKGGARNIGLYGLSYFVFKEVSSKTNLLPKKLVQVIKAISRIVDAVIVIFYIESKLLMSILAMENIYHFYVEHISGGKVPFFLDDMSKRPPVKLVGMKDKLKELSIALIKDKNNSVVITGPASLGGETLVNALQQQIQSGKAGASLKGKRILSLDSSKYLSTTLSLLPLRTRMQNVIELAKKEKNIILYIDQFAEMMKCPGIEVLLDAIKKGEVTAIMRLKGPGTQKIESDQILTLHCTSIFLAEQKDKDLMQILNQETSKIENKYNVIYRYEAIKAALAKAKGHDLVLKTALDILDGARANLQYDMDRGTEAQDEMFKRPFVGKKMIQNMPYNPGSAAPAGLYT